MTVNAEKSHLLIDDMVVSTMMDDLGIEVCQQLLQLFIVELEQMQQSLKQSVAEENIPQIISAVHILKNSAALYGANKLAVLSEELHSNVTLAPKDALQHTKTLISIAEQTRQEYQTQFTTQPKEGKQYDQSRS